MNKKELGRRIYIAVAVLLVAALLAATIVAALPREETPGGTIDTEAFADRENVKYSLNVIYEFRDYITTFQGNLINGILLFFGVEPVRGELSGALIADMITDFYFHNMTPFPAKTLFSAAVNGNGVIQILLFLRQ